LLQAYEFEYFSYLIGVKWIRITASSDLFLNEFDMWTVYVTETVIRHIGAAILLNTFSRLKRTKYAD